MPASPSPALRRRELGVLLRALRTDRGWTVKDVAGQLRSSPSKVSRFEEGLRGVSDSDIRRLCDVYEVQGERRQHLIDLAAAGKPHVKSQSGNLPYSYYVSLEADAASISDFGLGLVPGLLQTEGYARAVLTATYPPLAPGVLEQRLAGRLERQRLLTSADPPVFDAVIDEAVLRRVGGSRAIMRDQLDHLLTASEQENVRIWVIPYEAGILPFPTRKFIVLAFREPAVPGVVFLEGLTGDLYLGPEDGLAAYEQAFGAMKAMAASPAASRQMIRAIADELGRC